MSDRTKKCRVESCDRPVVPQRTLCVGHRERLRRFGDLRADVPLRHPHGKIEGNVCAVDGCTRTRTGSGRSRSSFCAGHASRKARTGDVRADVPLRPAVPANDPTVWCDYRTAHTRVRHALGKASEHRCIDCGGAAQEWAYRGGAAHEFSGPHARGGGVRSWSGDPQDYDPRCRSCHRRYDAARLTA